MAGISSIVVMPSALKCAMPAGEARPAKVPRISAGTPGWRFEKPRTCTSVIVVRSQAGAPDQGDAASGCATMAFGMAAPLSRRSGSRAPGGASNIVSSRTKGRSIAVA